MKNNLLTFLMLMLVGCVDKSTNSEQNLNIIENGGFEIIDTYTNFADSWHIYSVQGTFVEIDQTVSFEGNNSLHFYSVEEISVFSSVSTDLLPDKFSPGEKYELSFWIKHDSLAVYHFGWIDLLPMAAHFYDFFEPRKSTEWIQRKSSFIMPGDINSAKYYLQFHFGQLVKDIIPLLTLNIWFDNVELKKAN